MFIGFIRFALMLCILAAIGGFVASIIPLGVAIGYAGASLSAFVLTVV